MPRMNGKKTHTHTHTVPHRTYDFHYPEVPPRYEVYLAHHRLQLVGLDRYHLEQTYKIKLDPRTDPTLTTQQKLVPPIYNLPEPPLITVGGISDLMRSSLFGIIK